MTEPTNSELGEQFAANKHWRWAAGMRLVQTLDSGEVDAIRLDEIDLENGRTVSAGWLPDTADHATLGCIEHGLVPAALQDPDACLCFFPMEGRWYVYSPKHDECTTGKSTKPAALLAALEEADDIVRRSTAGAEVVEEEFSDLDGPDDCDGDWDLDGLDDVRAMQRLHAYDHDGVPADPAEKPTDPKLCTRPAPAQTVAARGFLETLRQRDADREAQRIAKLAKGTQA
jgi:hypothetical protein